MDGIGAGAVLHENRKEVEALSCKLPHSATVFAAEIQGVSIGVGLILDRFHVLKPRFLKIFCDSQAALKALASHQITSKLVAEASDKLQNLVNAGVNVRLVWVKAHVNHVGNERADVLAKEGTRLPDDDIVMVATPAIHFRNSIKAAAEARWENEWEKYPHARQTKQFSRQSIPNYLSK